MEKKNKLEKEGRVEVLENLCLNFLWAIWWLVKSLLRGFKRRVFLFGTDIQEGVAGGVYQDA